MSKKAVIVLVFLVSVLLRNTEADTDGCGLPKSAATLTADNVQPIVQIYVNTWNEAHSGDPLWVVLATPGEPITPPSVTFGTVEKPKAGMEVTFHVIALNKAMVPQSLLSTFLHEYGHATYRIERAAGKFDEIESEVAAIRFSLGALCKEGFLDLAYREEASIKEMASSEPYASAVAGLKNDPLWIKFAKPR